MYGFDLTLGTLGVVALVLAVCCLWWRRGVGQEMQLMASTPTSRAGDVGKLAPGALAEVKGMLRCAAPATGEFSQQPCVYFKAEIIREEVWYERDSDGKNRRKTSDTVTHSNIQFASCVIEDESGKVAVDLRDATVEGTEAVNRLENSPNAIGDLVGSVVGIGADSTSIRHKEVMLPPDIPVYLLGEVRADGSIGAPAKGSRNQTFLISNKSEEERTKNLNTSLSFLNWLIGIFLVSAAVLLLWARFKGRG